MKLSIRQLLLIGSALAGCLVFFLSAVNVFAHGKDHHLAKADEAPKYFTENVKVGVEENIGGYLPLHLSFKNESGERVVLSELINQPTLFLPAYFFCVTDCGVQLSFLASGLNKLTGFSYDEFQVVAFSFDPDDTPETARNSKNNYLPLTGEEFPPERWEFLTGDYESIRKVLDALGYRVRQTKKNVFDHANALVALGADGKIVRYLYGPRFLPFDMGMALTEAQSGRTGSSIRKVLSYCIDYDPEEQRYTFQYIRVFGIIIPLLLLTFYLVFLRKGNQS